MPVQSPSKRTQPLDRKGEEKQPSESGGNKGRRSKASAKDKENICPSREAKVPRQESRGQSSAVPSCRPRRRSSMLEEERRARPPPSRERRWGPPGSTLRRDSSHTQLHGKDQRPQPRAPGRRTRKRSRSPDSHGAPHKAAKRHRQPSPPEASSSVMFSPLMSRVFLNMGALQVALDDLHAPGGAFLRLPSSSKEPTVSQRAWLTWQLSHAGAALHWALHTVNSILTAQGSLPGYAWPQGDSFTADPRPVLGSSALGRPRPADWGRDQVTPHLPALPWFQEASWPEHSRPEGPAARP